MDIRELLKKCPHGEGSEPDCPLCEIRQLPPEDQEIAIEALSKPDATDICQLHLFCRRHRKTLD